MERGKRRASVQAGGAGTYRLADAKKKRRLMGISPRVLIVLVLVLLLLALFFTLMTRERGRAGIGKVTRIGATLSQNVSSFGSSVVFYDGTTLHCVSASGGNEWSYQIGSNADYDATDEKIAAWSGNDLYILNSRGRLTYNNKMTDKVQFASVGKGYVAVFIGDADDGVVTVIDEEGRTVDNIPVSGLTLVDMGFFEAQTTASGAGKAELLWLLGINTTGTVISMEMETYQPGRLSTGKSNLGEHLAYRVYEQGDGTLAIVTTREILHRNYRALESEPADLIYGYTLEDVRKSGSDTTLLLVPSSEQRAGAVSSIRLMSGRSDRMIHLPTPCMEVALGSRATYAFSQNAVYACRYGETVFESFAMPIQVTAVLGMLTDNRAVVASGSEVYTVELPL